MDWSKEFKNPNFTTSQNLMKSTKGRIEWNILLGEQVNRASLKIRASRKHHKGTQGIANSREATL